MRTLIILIALFLSNKAFASEMERLDSFLYQNVLYQVSGDIEFLMEAYFDKHPERKPTPTFFNDNLGRGYIATFQFRAEQLFLKDIRIRDKTDHFSGGKFISKMKHVLGPNKELKIDWFSGLVILPTGALMNEDEVARYNVIPKHDRYTLILIDKGNIVQKQDISYVYYQSCIDKQYVVYKHTNHYKENLDWVKFYIYRDTDDFKSKIVLWKDKPNINDDNPVRLSQKIDRAYRSSQMKAYENGLELWYKDTVSIRKVDSIMRANFEMNLSYQSVLIDSTKMSYYIKP